MNFVWKATLILTLAWGLALILQRSSASWRHSIWAASLLAVAGLPLIESLLPVITSDPTGGLLLSANAAATNAVRGSRDWLASMWIAGALLVALRIMVSHVRLERLRRAAIPSGAFGGIELRVSSEETSPMAAGWLSPVIILPASSAGWSASLRESVLRHEQAHVLRSDLWWSRLGDACCAALWFHPLAWLAAREMRREAEKACDDMVLAAGTAPADYAKDLISVARATVSAPDAAVAMTGRSPFESRVRSILNLHASRRHVPALAVALAGVVLLAPLAAFQEPYKPSEHKDITRPRLVWKVEPKYTEEARDAKIEGKVILSVVVTRAGRADEIQIVQGLDPGLDLQAIHAVQQWEFEPATKKGEPVAVRATIEVNFRLM